MPQRARPCAIDCRVVPALGAWAEAWDELAAQAAVPSPFLRSWWLTAVAGENPEFLLIIQGATLIGGLALERRRKVFAVPLYRFVGSGTLCPDHLDLLAARGKEGPVRDAFLDWFARPGSRVLDLDGLVENSLLSSMFGRKATTVIDVAPWTELPSDGAAYVAALSSNLRKTLRQARHRLDAANVHHRRVPAGDMAATAVALKEFLHLQAQRDDRKALRREMPKLMSALMTGTAAGDVQIDVLESGDRAVLVLISFRLGGAVRAYQSARGLDRDIRDAGYVALVELAKQACADGYRELDLLRGNEGYKSRFARRQRAICRLRVAHGSLGAVLLGALEMLTRMRGVAGRVRRSLKAHRGFGCAGRIRRRAEE